MSGTYLLIQEYQTVPVNQPVAQNGNGYAAQNVEAYAMQQVQPQEQQPAPAANPFKNQSANNPFRK